MGAGGMSALDTVQCGQCGARWRAKDLADGGHDCGIQPQAITPESIAAIVNERDSLRREVGKLTRSKDYAARLHKTEIERLTAAFEKSQDDLATARAELSESDAALRRVNGDYQRAAARAHQLEVEAAAALAVARMNARSGASWAREAMAARTADAKPEYVFGPWLRPEKGTNPIPVGAPYEWRHDNGSTGFAKSNPNLPFGGANMIRRAWRIGEWHDHDRTPCQLESGTQVEIEARGSGAIFRHTAHLGERWGGVKRFRPIGAAS